MKDVYVVVAYRFGDYESHSYVCGVFSSKEKAEEVAENENEHKGRKYICEIIRMEIDVYRNLGKKVKQIKQYFFGYELSS